MRRQTLVDVWTLFRLFVAWKLLLLCIACISPGPGYDTSTHLLLRHASINNESVAPLVECLASKLVRWDALYFTSIAHRGYLFEQEWAFGWGFTRLLAMISKAIPATSIPPLYVRALTGIVVAHASHLLSVIVLYGLVFEFHFLEEPRRRQVAFVAASLHIFSSAGLFLSAPYSESLFALLNFLGVLIHVRIPWQQPLHQYGLTSLLSLLGSGACFGLASTVRSNGILSALIFVHHLYLLFQSRLNFRTFIAIAAIGLSAGMMLLGVLVPQYIAYQDFCMMAAKAGGRPWCSRGLPSIYTWVQDHYWNVGFLRYWTISNVPLFLLALPMLFLLVATGLVASSAKLASIGQKTQQPVAYMRCLALPQVVLALLALTNFHVQIINRIATGYPVWYVVLAASMVPQDQRCKDETNDSKQTRSMVDQFRTYLDKPSTQQAIFRGMMIYSIIQGGLYASFLPPA